MMIDIPPQNLVNRHAELEEFLTLVKFNKPARLLVIDDDDGTGKSSLMRILEYNCRYHCDPPILVGKVLLEQQTLTDPFMLVWSLRKDIADKDPELKLPQFDMSMSTGALIALGDSTNRIDNAGATVTNSTQINQLIQTGGPPSATQQEAYRLQCIKDFFRDIKDICVDRPMVLLVDSYERRQPGLQNWILDTLLWQLCTGPNPPQKLICVLAGKDLPDFQVMLGARYEDLVRSRTGLTWQKEHIKDFLAVHGFEPSESDLETICDKVLNHNFSIARALRLAEALKPRI